MPISFKDWEHYKDLNFVIFICKDLDTEWLSKGHLFFFFSFAYTTRPAAVMKLVVFFRSSKPPYNFWKDICLVRLFKKQITILACRNQCWEMKISLLEEPRITTDNLIGFGLVWLVIPRLQDWPTWLGKSRPLEWIKWTNNNNNFWCRCTIIFTINVQLFRTPTPTRRFVLWCMCVQRFYPLTWTLCWAHLTAIWKLFHPSLFFSCKDAPCFTRTCMTARLSLVQASINGVLI